MHTIRDSGVVSTKWDFYIKPFSPNFRDFWMFIGYVIEAVVVDDFTKTIFSGHFMEVGIINSSLGTLCVRSIQA